MELLEPVPSSRKRMTSWPIRISSWGMGGFTFVSEVCYCNLGCLRLVSMRLPNCRELSHKTCDVRLHHILLYFLLWAIVLLDKRIRLPWFRLPLPLRLKW